MVGDDLKPVDHEPGRGPGRGLEPATTIFDGARDSWTFDPQRGKVLADLEGDLVSNVAERLLRMAGARADAAAVDQVVDDAASFHVTVGRRRLQARLIGVPVFGLPQELDPSCLAGDDDGHRPSSVVREAFSNVGPEDFGAERLVPVALMLGYEDLGDLRTPVPFRFLSTSIKRAVEQAEGVQRAVLAGCSTRRPPRHLLPSRIPDLLCFVDEGGAVAPVLAAMAFAVVYAERLGPPSRRSIVHLRQGVAAPAVRYGAAQTFAHAAAELSARVVAAVMRLRCDLPPFVTDPGETLHWYDRLDDRSYMGRKVLAGIETGAGAVSHSDWSYRRLEWRGAAFVAALGTIFPKFVEHDDLVGFPDERNAGEPAPGDVPADVVVGEAISRRVGFENLTRVLSDLFRNKRNLGAVEGLRLSALVGERPHPPGTWEPTIPLEDIPAHLRSYREMADAMTERNPSAAPTIGGSIARAAKIAAQDILEERREKRPASERRTAIAREWERLVLDMPVAVFLVDEDVDRSIDLDERRRITRSEDHIDGKPTVAPPVHLEDGCRVDLEFRPVYSEGECLKFRTLHGYLVSPDEHVLALLRIEIVAERFRGAGEAMSEGGFHDQMDEPSEEHASIASRLMELPQFENDPEALFENGDLAVVQELLVRPDRRREGMARRLLDASFALLKKRHPGIGTLLVPIYSREIQVDVGRRAPPDVRMTYLSLTAPVRRLFSAPEAPTLGKGSRTIVFDEAIDMSDAEILASFK